MTRLSKPPGDTPGITPRFDLPAAFKFLGEGPSRRDLGVAANLLRQSGLERLDYDEELSDLAERNGSMGIVALDLAVVFAHDCDPSILSRGPMHGTRGDDDDES
jgi:hypothetical protein